MAPAAIKSNRGTSCRDDMRSGRGIFRADGQEDPGRATVPLEGPRTVLPRPHRPSVSPSDATLLSPSAAWAPYIRWMIQRLPKAGNRHRRRMLSDALAVVNQSRGKSCCH
jgi:hypothetical protein